MKGLVRDHMTRGFVAASPQTPAREIARLMATNDVHCVLIEGIAGDDGGERLVWGLVTDLDLMAAVAGEHLEASAGEMAATAVLTVAEEDGLARAASLMAEHGSTHLVTVRGDTGEPTGVISTLDVAQATAAV